MRLCKKALIVFLFTLIFSACTARTPSNRTVEKMLLADIDFLVDKIQEMYNDVRPELLYEPPLYIAFADVDFDSIPEFFYGYETMTSSHVKIWYRAYSLKDRAIISSEHLTNWETYVRGDDDCAFYTGPDSFLEGYFIDDNAKPTIITQTYAGPVVDIRLDVCMIQYRDSKLFITEVNWSEVNWHDENLIQLKQAWSVTTTDSVKDDAIKLLSEYFEKDAA